MAKVAECDRAQANGEDYQASGHSQTITLSD